MGFLDLIFPKKCVGCGRPGNYFCSECLVTIREIRQICPVCEKPTPFGQTHPLCQTRYSPDGLFSFFAYEGIVKKAIHDLKYRFITDLENEFWKVIRESIKKREEEMMVLRKFIAEERPIILPIPLHWRKENFRGFNQSSLFAKRMSSLFNLPFSDKILVRRKNVPSQTKLTQKEREKNVKGIFGISPRVSRLFSPIIHNSLFNILLVDDVWTTGATLKEAIKTLKSRGVKKVWGLTITRKLALDKLYKILYN